MMERLMARGEKIAAKRRKREVGRVAERMRTLLGSGPVDALEAQVLVRGRGLIKRWLYDPRLRFLLGELT
jgi:hypothetical protein